MNNPLQGRLTHRPVTALSLPLELPTRTLSRPLSLPLPLVGTALRAATVRTLVTRMPKPVKLEVPTLQEGSMDNKNNTQWGGANGGAGGDFWTELSNTNSLLGQLQEQIQAVRTAHQTSLVSVI